MSSNEESEQCIHNIENQICKLNGDSGYDASKIRDLDSHIRELEGEIDSLAVDYDNW